jgi:hypothetical protein
MSEGTNNLVKNVNKFWGRMQPWGPLVVFSSAPDPRVIDHNPEEAWPFAKEVKNVAPPGKVAGFGIVKNPDGRVYGWSGQI